MIIEIPHGWDINAATKSACRFAEDVGETVRFDFNGIALTADPQSCHTDIVKIYWLEHKIRQLESRV